jgi:hypothetical protein
LKSLHLYREIAWGNRIAWKLKNTSQVCYTNTPALDYGIKVEVPSACLVERSPDDSYDQRCSTDDKAYGNGPVSPVSLSRNIGAA